MIRKNWPVLFAVIVTAFLTGTGLLWFVYRPWSLYWGATAQEEFRPMPGDSILVDPSFNATRAISIDGKPSDIWPWLVQMGYLRAGFYSYDVLDNDGVPSAVRILHEYQALDLGDSIPLTDHGWVTVTVMHPDSTMLWEYKGRDAKTVFTWVWGLYPVDNNATRLVTRLRYNARSLRTQLMLDFFEILMMRKCMLGIRDRVETHSQL